MTLILNISTILNIQYTILFGLSESFKKTLFKDLVRKLIAVKVAENDIINFTSIISGIIGLNKVIFYYCDRSIRIIQINELTSFYYSVIFIEIFNLKFGYAINSRV